MDDPALLDKAACAWVAGGEAWGAPGAAGMEAVVGVVPWGRSGVCAVILADASVEVRAAVDAGEDVSSMSSPVGAGVVGKGLPGGETLWSAVSGARGT